MVFGTTILGSNPSAPAKQMNNVSLNNNLIKKIKKIFFPFYKSKEISKVFNILEQGHPMDKKVAMFVGGCVRKHILGEEIDDIDIATILKPEEIKEKFRNTKIEVIDTGIEHGSVTLLLNKSKFELTTLRKDVKTYGRHAEVSFTDDWKLDSERRDFTINAIYLDRKGNIFDPQLGIKDLKNGVVKFIGDPSKRIEEDYLRIIRFIRFALQYNHSIFEPSTIQAIKTNLNGIKNLSKERILKELIKIIELVNFRNILKIENLKSVFSIIFPEFKNLNRINKLFELSDNDLFGLDINVILGMLLIDESDNHEYFCHKYKTSKSIRDSLNLLAEKFKEYRSDKNFFKKNLKKNIYFLGKKKLKDFALFIYLSNKKWSFKDLKNINENIEKMLIPKFPYDGKYLIEKGFSEGKKIGLILKELEKQWIKNNCNLKEEDVLNIIKRSKKLEIFNI